MPDRRQRLKAAARRLWREHASPPRLGLAVGLGVVVGCSPFFGLHLWIGLALALLLRLNKVALFLGSQISIPPLAPLIGFASVQLGAVLRGETLVRPDLDDFSLARLPGVLQSFFVDWLLGGLVLGACLGLPAALITWTVVRQRRRNRAGAAGQEAGPSAEPVQPVLQGDRQLQADLRRAAERYREAPAGHRHYARIKYRMDPGYAQICALLGQRGSVVDLGTGLAMLPVLLALRGQADRVLGVEWDEAKLASARLAAAGLAAVALSQHDVRRFVLEPASADAVVLMDVLHYFPLQEQRELLRRSAAALTPGGVLVVRDTDGAARSWLTRWIEALAVRWGWNRGPGLCYRTAAELEQELSSCGLELLPRASSSSQVHRGNVLLAARRLQP